MAAMSARNPNKLNSRDPADRLARIAAFFREQRQKSGLTVEQVAREIGLEDPSILLKYESGHEPIPLDEIFALTNALNVPPEEVLDLILETYDQGQK